jgi:hypothetical protein
MSHVAFPGQWIRNYVGTRIVETHICGNAEVTETELLEIAISFAPSPQLFRCRSVESFQSEQVLAGSSGGV